MEPITKTYTVSEAKRRFLELVEQIETMHEMVTLTRNGIPTTILMSLSDYEALLETLEILADPKILKSLKKSRREARQGRLLAPDEVWD